MLEGTVCTQSGYRIVEVFACPEYGSQGNCAGITHCERCDAEAECVVGDQMCLDECRCGFAYKECIGSKWVERPLASKI